MNLYRISAIDDEIRDKIIALSQLKHIVCYIPNDDFNGYLLTGESKNPIQVYEDEDIERKNPYIYLTNQYQPTEYKKFLTQGFKIPRSSENISDGLTYTKLQCNLQYCF